MSSKEPLFAFFGTSDFVLPALNALESKGIVPALVVTAPDKARGRSKELQPTAVKAWALERGIDVITPPTLKDEALIAELANTEWDFFLVASYGKFLPKAMLDIPKHGCINIHPSLLPKYRGPSPFISAILADDRATGVSIMQMEEVMDAGPVLAQARTEIDETDWPLTSSILSELLFTEGGNLVAEILPELMAGTLTLEEQDQTLATFTKKFTPEDAKVDLNADARQNFLKIRAFDKNPRAHFFIYPDGTGGAPKRVIITEAEFVDGALKILKVIPEGKKEMDYKVFCSLTNLTKL